MLLGLGRLSMDEKFDLEFVVVNCLERQVYRLHEISVAPDRRLNGLLWSHVRKAEILLFLFHPVTSVRKAEILLFLLLQMELHNLACSLLQILVGFGDSISLVICTTEGKHYR